MAQYLSVTTLSDIYWKKIDSITLLGQHTSCFLPSLAVWKINYSPSIHEWHYEIYFRYLCLENLMSVVPVMFFLSEVAEIACAETLFDKIRENNEKHITNKQNNKHK